MTVAFQRMFGILERWNNNQVTPSLSKPHELSYRSNNNFLTYKCFIETTQIYKWQLQNIGFPEQKYLLDKYYKTKAIQILHQTTIQCDE